MAEIELPRPRALLMRLLREVGRRVLDLGDKLLFPEAESASDQWQRVVMNGVVDRHLSSLGLHP